jgi:ADP-ribose pyrophosphatase YjhB (NUDIX family)
MRVEVRAAIVVEDRIAIVEERRHGVPRLLLPGGRVNRWETTRDALVREVREELGVEVEIGAFVCAFEVVERFAVQDVNLVFQAALADPEDAAGLTLVDPRSAAEVFPPVLDDIAFLLQAPVTPRRWLGNVWNGALRAAPA